MKYFFIIALMIFSLNQSIAAERFVVPLDDSTNITTSAKSFNLDGVLVKAEISNKPEPFIPFDLKLEFTKDNSPVTPKNVFIKINMSMDMGKYHYAAKQKQANIFSVKPILPKCIWGGKVWFSKLTFDIGDKSYSKVFYFFIEN
jgi:hypothetical protein